ncbi:hypothetical protein MKW92_043854 [Papaver armeniacum]|nr:hypothetical protein MKW92_043854 [Papaver armeniacum]
MEKSLKSAPKSTSQQKMEELEEEEETAASNINHEVEVAEGYTITQFCDKAIDVFLNEKPQTKDWRKLLVFREEWKKYSEKFYNQCKARADAENDNGMKQKLVFLGRKVKKIDGEIERHSELLKEIEQDINAVVAKRRKDFNEEFFRHLTLLSETYDSLDDHDGKQITLRI